MARTATLVLGTVGLATAAWRQDRFAIGLWVDPIVPPAEFNARYAEIAAAGFTTLLGNFGANNSKSVAWQLDACARHGLKAIVDTCGGHVAPPGACVSPRFASSPAFWGYIVKDEPIASEIGALAEWSRAISEVVPDALRFVNLLPNYAPPSQLNASSYGDYVDAYVDGFAAAGGPDVISTDHYPYFEPGYVAAPNASLHGYRLNLGVLRDRALRAGVPFWNFFNAMPFGRHSAPTEGQMAWQLFTSLAFGAKGVLYFCYWNPVGPDGKPTPGAIHRSLRGSGGLGADHRGTFDKGGALLSPVGHGDLGVGFEPSAAYEISARLNPIVRSFGEALLEATSTGVWHFRPNGTDDDAPPQRLAGEDDGTSASCAIASLRETNASGAPHVGEIPGGDYLVGQFSMPRGDGTAVLLVNQRPDVSLWPTVQFALPPWRPPLEVDGRTGRTRPVRDDSPLLAGLQLSLSPGAARLLLLPA